MAEMLKYSIEMLYLSTNLCKFVYEKTTTYNCYCGPNVLHHFN